MPYFYIRRGDPLDDIRVRGAAHGLDGVLRLAEPARLATNGSAVSGADYTSASGTLTFDPGVTSRTILVPIAGDLDGEDDEQ